MLRRRRWRGCSGAIEWQGGNGNRSARRSEGRSTSSSMATGNSAGMLRKVGGNVATKPTRQGWRVASSIIASFGLSTGMPACRRGRGRTAPGRPKGCRRAGSYARLAASRGRRRGWPGPPSGASAWMRAMRGMSAPSEVLDARAPDRANPSRRLARRRSRLSPTASPRPRCPRCRSLRLHRPFRRSRLPRR